MMGSGDLRCQVRLRDTAAGRVARVAVLAILAPVLACCAAIGAPAGPGLQPTVQVALVDMFSGQSGARGQYAQNGVQLAVDELNRQGGLLGHRVEVVAADDEHSPAKASRLVEQELSDDGVKLLVGPSSTAGFQAVRSSIARAALPNCLTGVADDAISGAPFSFRVAPSDHARVAALLGYLHRARPEVQRIGLLDGGDGGAQAYDQQLASLAGGSGLRYVGRVAGADPAAVLQQLAGQGAQAVVLPDSTAMATQAAQAVQQLGLAGRLQLLGFGALAAYGFPGQGGAPAAGSLLATTTQAYLTGVPAGAWPAGYRAFVSTAAQEFGYATNGVEVQASAAAADCVREWAQSVRRAGTFEGRAVAGAWQQLDLPAGATALGVRERPSASDHTAVGADGVVVYTWTQDGSRYQLKQVG